MDFPAFQHAQRPARGLPAGETGCIHLNPHAALAQIGHNIPMLEGKVPLHMRQHRLDSALRQQLVYIIQHAPGPFAKRHFQKHRTGLADAQPVGGLRTADAVVVGHLCAQIELWQVLMPLHGGQQPLARLPPSDQKAVRRFAVGVEVRGQDDLVHALRRFGKEHLQAFLGAGAAVIHARQNMSMQIQHIVTSLSAGSNDRFRSACSSGTCTCRGNGSDSCPACRRRR